MLLADFIDLAALNGCVLIINIVELDLNDLNLRMLRQDHIQYIRLIVEGNSHVPDQTFFFELISSLICPAACELFIIVLILRMHQIKVKILNAAPCKLLFKEGADVLLFLEIRIGELIGQKEPAPVIPL